VPFSVAARLVAALADAVEHAHRRGVLHRDLKPSNVMLSPLPGPPGSDELDFVPRVMDFGLAKLLDAPAAGHSPTLSGAVLGTPQYMAPEQARGQSRYVGPAADVYSLGAILYELLVGRQPFQADTPVDLLLQVSTEEPVAPARLRARVPRDLETICLKCLHKEPGKRYASAADLAADLRHFLACEPIRARRVGAVGRLVLWCRRKPALASTVAAAVLAVAAVASVAFAMVLHERDLFREERDRAQNHLYRSLVSDASAQIQARDTGWWWKAMDSIRQASRLDVPGRDTAALRELAIECLGTGNPCFRLHATWEGHTGAVTAVDFSPDGRRAASGSADGTVRLWSVPQGRSQAVLTGHTKAVTGVTFHRGGRLLASASGDGDVRLWDLGNAGLSGGKLRPLSLPLGGGGVAAVAFSSDGAWLLAGCHDGTIHALAVAANDLLRGRLAAPGTPGHRVLLGHTGAVTCLCAPGGDGLVSGSADRTIRRWNLATGKQLDSWSTRNVPATLTLLRGRYLVWAEPEIYGFNYRDLVHFTATERSHVHTGAVTGVRSDARGRLLTASADGTLKLWFNLQSASEIAVARGDFSAARCAAFAPDGARWVAAGHSDGRVRLWELAEPPQRGLVYGQCQRAVFLGRQRHLLNPPHLHHLDRDMHEPGQEVLPPPVAALAIHPDGQRFAFATDSTLRVWKLPLPAEVRQWAGHRQTITDLVCRPDGRQLASASQDGTVKLWDWDGKALGSPLAANVGALHSLAWDRSGTRLAASGQRGAVVWDLNHSGAPRRLQEHSLSASAVAFGRGVVAISGAEGTVVVHALEPGTPPRTLRGHSSVVTALAFSPDGSRLASAGFGTVRLWDTARWLEATGPLQSPISWGWRHCLAFDSQGRYLLENNNVRDLRTPGMVAHLEARTATCGRFIRDGTALLVGTVHGSVHLYPVAEVDRALAPVGHGVPQAVTFPFPRLADRPPLVPGPEHPNRTWGLAASPDGRWFATGTHDHAVHLWDARSLKVARTMSGHSDVVWCVAFSPDSRYLASGSARKGSGEIKVWQVSTGREVCSVTGHDHLVLGLAFHPGGRLLASASGDGSVRLWDVEARRPLGLLHRFEQGVWDLAFRPDGRRLAAACLDGRVALWDTSTVPPLPAPPGQTLTGHARGVRAVSFSPDGRYLASGSEQGVIILWDGETFDRVVTLRGSTKQIRSLCFSADSQLLAGGAYTSPTVVWDLAGLRHTLGEMGLDW
jgi:WD40 repeat protein